MALQRKANLRKTPSAPRAPKWWHRPVGAVLVLGGIALTVLILVTSGGTAANVSKHVLGASIVFAILVGVGVLLLVPNFFIVFWVAALWVVPAAFIWLGVEHWFDWHAFYDSGGRYRVTSQTGARIQGTFFVVFGVVGFVIWAAATRAFLKLRRSGTRA